MRLVFCMPYSAGVVSCVDVAVRSRLSVEALVRHGGAINKHVGAPPHHSSLTLIMLVGRIRYGEKLAPRNPPFPPRCAPAGPSSHVASRVVVGRRARIHVMAKRLKQLPRPKSSRHAPCF